MFKTLRAKMIQDELYTLYRDSHFAWLYADKGAAHLRFAKKVDERIEYLEKKIARLLGENTVLETVAEKVSEALDNSTGHPVV